MKSPLIALLFPVFLIGQPDSKNQSLDELSFAADIAVHPREGGKTAESIHLLQFSCRKGQCTLVVATLNQCRTVAQAPPFFYPKLEVSHTHDGSLRVVRSGSVFEVVRNAIMAGPLSGAHTLTLRMAIPKTSMADDELGTVSSFEGRLVKQSKLLGKEIIIDWIPVKTPIEITDFSCPVVLQGVRN